MKKATLSNSKKCEHSDKDCVCGGHNINNHKKNKRHYKTNRKKIRKALEKIDL